MNKKVFQFVNFKRNGRFSTAIETIKDYNTSRYAMVLLAVGLTVLNCAFTNIDIIFSAAVPIFNCISDKKNITSLNNQILIKNEFYLDNDMCFNQNGCPIIAFSDEFEYTIPIKWSLICERSFYVFLLNLSVSLGMTLSCFWNGYLADRFGRKTSSTVSLLLNIMLRIISLFVNSIELYIGFRLALSALDISMYMHVYLLCIELTPQKYRIFSDVARSFFYSIGILSLPLIFYILGHWINVQIFIAITTLICLILVSKKLDTLVKVNNVDQ
ncbi:hypothetical protein A3Q56_05171 [Intoshia linei]|uniref:Major facilitator superfamily (MFS) profile domain-containing protein n=1 Tax=Intoshia linei TaxID=1819745 RepID=A0A177B045_9BILA|nr:hypothetical protein A3Q56_05171 [Intoshia linei]